MMSILQSIISRFDTTAFFRQFLYDPENPLLFNNGFFVYFFFLFITLFYVLREKPTARKYVFTFFSLYFFYKASGVFVLLVIFSGIFNFVLSNVIYRLREQSSRTLALVLSIVVNLGVLFYFKYTNFFISVTNEIFKTGFNPLHILLPIGISFYTFENLSYTIDVYRRQFAPAKYFVDYLLFLAFFPKLMMGPIVRAEDFVPQLDKQYFITERDFAKGFWLIILGLVKKLIISDYITLNLVNYVFENPSLHTGLEILVALYGYAMVIYCDFSGYSDVAIGIALWLGFKIPPNFLSPYSSKSVTEFWKNWHISLSSWLKDYLYIPLGGNRKGTWASYIFTGLFLVGSFLMMNKLLSFSYAVSGAISFGLLIIFVLPSLLTGNYKGIPTNFNLLTTMLLGGFWHGASWNFIIWGALHGIALGIHKIWMMLTGKIFSGFNQSKVYNVLMAVLTFHFVCFCWIFFKAEDFNASMIIIKQILFDFHTETWYAFYDNYKTAIFMIVVAMAIHSIPNDIADRLPKISFAVYIVVFFVFLVLYAYFKAAEQVMPIYLQF